MSDSGIHHVTAIVGSPQRNLDFYRRVLGLRLIKKTVNFDDPGSYHLYYGDDAGSTTATTRAAGHHPDLLPLGTGSPRAGGIGRGAGNGIPYPSRGRGVLVAPVAGERVASGAHGAVRRNAAVVPRPDGLRLALAAAPGIEAGERHGDDIPGEHAILGFHAVTLTLDDTAATGAILSGVFRFAEGGTEQNVTRYRASAGLGGIVDLHATKDLRRAGLGRGSVHHLAFRAADDAAQAAMVRTLAEAHGIATTDQKDRTYFRSVYFREPGGVLFEIATDQPGFTIDEPADALGTALKLPRFLEARRQEIEAALPVLA
jgi:glyoxalase family protein